MTPMPARASRWQDAAHAPGVVAVIGASENPDKVGGRPIRYMQRFGFAGRILPVNPTRREVQGLPAFPHLADLPARPDLAIIAVPAAAARDAVDACAAAGVGVAVVLTSGFGETGGEGRRLQQEMVATARTAGMRLIGPNTQGIANFGNGTIASFATLFGEIAPADGPVAIVSQSGAMSVVPYAHLRRQGIGVRYAHATGNEADVTVADLAFGVLEDPEIRLLLLYLENLEDPETLARVAARAHARNIPVLALKAGRSARGAAAAQSHTGALAGEDRVVDAFLRRIGILRVDDMHDLVDAAELFLTVRRRPGHRLLVVSNSGASCVLAADRAESEGLTLPPLPAATRAQLTEVLPPFATADNPLDLTGALLSQSAMLGQALAALAAHDIADHLLLALPNAGAGYDLAGFAAATAVWRAQTGGAAAVSTPNPAAAAVFRAAGLATFDHDGHAVAALGTAGSLGRAAGRAHARYAAPRRSDRAAGAAARAARERAPRQRARLATRARGMRLADAAHGAVPLGAGGTRGGSDVAGAAGGEGLLARRPTQVRARPGATRTAHTG